MIILLEKKPPLDIKNEFYGVAILGFFLTELTHDFGQKLKISYLFVLGQNGH